MNVFLLIDFGSTFTKICSIDIDSETILGSAQAPTTINSDITIGLKDAISILEQKTGQLRYSKKLACSSAAGGLKIAVSGLVESLTLKAARMAALGAGAKITHSFHHELTDFDLKEMKKNPPDIFLLAGGTDGGNSDVILFNARKIADMKALFTVIYAGNRSAEDEAVDVMRTSGKSVYSCPNIMPSMDKLNIEPVNTVIRELFLNKITKAKGLKKAEDMIDSILMPTPYAVLLAAEILADGFGDERGLGEMIVIDAGGATTDVHSVCDGYSNIKNVICNGIIEPRIKRTVEGDLGVRHNADSIVEAAKNQYGGFSNQAENKSIHRLLDIIKKQPSVLFDMKENSFDSKLCSFAVKMAVKRHCGTLEKYYTPHGIRYLQYGKDFTGVKTIIGTGGPLLRSFRPFEILNEALYKETEPDILRPSDATLYLDKYYILFAAGLLCSVDKKKALRIMKKSIIEAGVVK